MVKFSTYVEVIEELRKLHGINRDLVLQMQQIADNNKGHRDVGIVLEVVKAFKVTADQLRDLSSSVANLGLANSNEDHEKILEALSK